MALSAVSGVALQATPVFREIPEVDNRVGQAAERTFSSVSLQRELKWIWNYVVFPAVKAAWTLISELFFRTLGLMIPDLDSKLESLGFYVLELSGRVGGVWAERRQHRIEDLQNEKQNLQGCVERLKGENAELSRKNCEVGEELRRVRELRDGFVRQRDAAVDEGIAEASQRAGLAQRVAFLEQELGTRDRTEEAARKEMKQVIEEKWGVVHQMHLLREEKERVVEERDRWQGERNRIVQEMKNLPVQQACPDWNKDLAQALDRIAGHCASLPANPRGKGALEKEIEELLPLLRKHKEETLQMLHEAMETLPQGHAAGIALCNLERIIGSEAGQFERISQVFQLHDSLRRLFERPLQKQFNLN